MKKGDVGMALKSTEQGMSFQLPAIVRQDPYQRLMLHPYITASRTIVLQMCVTIVPLMIES